MIKDLFTNNPFRKKKSTCYIAVLAGSFSLAFFTRCLQFFRTPNFAKTVVWVSLFVFFFLILLIFVQPVVTGLLNHKKFLAISTLIAVTAVTGLFVLLPYQNVPFRTFHQLTVSVPSGSHEVILGRLTGPDGNSIPFDEMVTSGELVNASLHLQPGQSLEYVREMTGSVSFEARASSLPAQIMVQWDDNNRVIDLQADKSVLVETDPHSWGNPPGGLYLFFIGIIFNEWLAMVMALTILIGAFLLIATNADFKYQIYFPNLLRFLTDYLLLSGTLIIIGLARIFFYPHRQTLLLVLITPGLAYLIIKIVYKIFPALPILIMGAGILLNVMAGTILENYYLLTVRKMVDKTFNELAILVHPSEATLMSVGFYKQLREANLILPSDSEFADETNSQRLIKINRLENLYIEDYSGKLSPQTARQLLENEEWEKWDNLRSGSNYFYTSESFEDTPIVLYYSGNDIFLIPVEQTKKLGLFHDFILD